MDNKLENNEENVQVIENDKTEKVEKENVKENIKDTPNIQEEVTCVDVKNDNSTKEKTSDKEQESKEYTIDSIPKKKGKLKKFLIVILITLVLVLITATLSTIFAVVNLNNKNIINGISIANIDVSNLSMEDATLKISSAMESKLSQQFSLYYGKYEVKVIPSQFEAAFDIKGSVSEAYSIGRSDNLVKDNFSILNLLFKKCNITPTLKYSESAMDSLIAEMQSNIPDHLVDPSYYIEGSSLNITSGEDGIVIQKDLLKEKIVEFINNFNTTNNKIEIPVKDKRAESIDIDKIYSEVHREPKDAYYTTDPVTIYPHVDGIDFAISIDEAKNIVQEPGKDTYTIPLIITTPEVTIKQLGTEAFPDLLATFTTKYSTANVNRSTNIYLAAKKINGIVILPGETFSYNQTVGKRTAAAGFKEAAVYAGGQVTTDIGGGICQVSTTLYNAVLLANLEIVERVNHGFNPGYVKAGTDATVSWGGPDFKFKNTRNYPIKVVCSTNNGTILFNLYGLKEKNEYEVSVEATITSYIPYKTITQDDPTLEVGQTKVLESGSSGCRSITYRVLKQNGQEVSRTLLSQDTYNPHHRIVAVGTKPVTPPAQVVTSEPEEQQAKPETTTQTTEVTEQSSSTQQTEPSQTE